MRLIGYARLSRASLESTSIEKQKQIITAEAERRGAELISIEVDENVSAAKTRLNRPGLDRVREAISTGEADAVLCWRLDRIARSVVDFGTLLDEGLSVISASEPVIDTTSSMGRAMVEIMQVFAGLEARTAGERSRATKAFLRSKRRWGGGPRPYGYRPEPAPDGIGKLLYIEEKEAEVIRRIFRDLLDGASVNTLARQLNTEGTPTARGGLWKPASILNLARAFHVSGYLTERVAEGSRERRPVVDEAGQPVRAWDAIVDDEIAEAVRALVTPETIDAARSAATRAGLSTPKQLLQGIAHCPCGEPLIRRVRKGRTFYGCRGHAVGPHVLVDAELVDAEATRQFLRMTGGVRVTERIVSGADRDAAEIDASIRHLTAEVQHTRADNLQPLFERITQLTTEREQLLSAGDQVVVRHSHQNYADAWEGWTVEERREHMLSLGTLVSIRPAPRRGTWDPWRVKLTTDHDDLSGHLDD